MGPRTRIRISQFNSLKRIISQQCYNLFLRSLVKEVGVELSPYQQYYAAYRLAIDSKPPPQIRIKSIRRKSIFMAKRVIPRCYCWLQIFVSMCIYTVS